MSESTGVLGLHLSPNKNGSSKALLESFGQGVKEAGARFSILSISDFSNLSGCVECGSCANTGHCQINDDMDVFYKAFDGATKIVVSTSLFFYDIPSQGKAVIDRSQAHWSRRYVLGQNEKGIPGASGFLLAVGATKGKDLFLPVALSVKYFFDALAFPKNFGTLFFRNIEGPSNLTSEHLLQAKEAGYEFASIN